MQTAGKAIFDQNETLKKAVNHRADLVIRLQGDNELLTQLREKDWSEFEAYEASAEERVTELGLQLLAVADRPAVAVRTAMEVDSPENPPAADASGVQSSNSSYGQELKCVRGQLSTFEKEQQRILKTIKEQKQTIRVLKGDIVDVQESVSELQSEDKVTQKSTLQPPQAGEAMVIPGIKSEIQMYHPLGSAGVVPPPLAAPSSNITQLICDTNVAEKKRKHNRRRHRTSEFCQIFTQGCRA